ncbi:MAG: rRNA pseudouridine synthase [Selenomonadaceae bacterium]|nr:rRNA pseudouridine synthase [Selenomonadaceae bacterium]MBR1730776.1 rRNA pseudouridine synthase [Selenomonadaceae bacterium]
MSEERLQKILSRAGIASRREAEKMILEGRVSVNDKIINKLGQKFESTTCKICVDGKIISQVESKIYILLNKPKNIISSVKDDRGRTTVIDLITDIKERIYPVGRLDFDTEGLILLTNDGELMNALLHPKFQINKTYLAKITGTITEDKLIKLRTGIKLDDGITAPATVDVIKNLGTTSKIEITIHEGRNRQIRRMLSAIGCEVKSLKRIKFANLSIYGLKSGEYRQLTEMEINNLYKLTSLR